MNWIQATFVIDAEQVDSVTAMLETFLAQAITSENAGHDEYYEVAFPGIPSWQKVRLTALFDEAIDLSPIIEFVKAQLAKSHQLETPVTVAKLIDQDWERVWLDSFEPIEVGTNLWVCPSWCAPKDPLARNILLDPGLAFGTGTHATTHMCLRWLSEQSLTDKSVLDYGSGSGILAIAALMSGAKHADAVDIDPLAVTACMENAHRNKVDQAMSAWLPQDLPTEPRCRYNLVIANILADVIIELRDTLMHNLHPDGVLLLTGILDTQAERVMNAIGDHLEYDVFHQDQWCLLIATNKKSSL